MNPKNKIIPWIGFFILFLLISQFFFKKPSEPPVELAKSPLGIMPLKTEYVKGEEVTVKLRNNTDTKVTLPSECPKNPLRVLMWTGEKFEEKVTKAAISCEELAPPIEIAPKEEKIVSYTYWNYALFGNLGRYKIQLVYNQGTSTVTIDSSEFTVTEPGMLRKIFRTAFYQPLYNVLVFFISIAPGRDLGFAIILLTILIRLILLVPSQRAIVSQREMQALQPKLEALKKKYAGNQERIAQETMKLWKEHKVNPFGSCLPILIQFPVLIALFYVIQTGLNPDNIYFLYSPLKSFDMSNIHTNFLGILDLTKINRFVLPIIIGLLQFLQFKLSVAKKSQSTNAAAGEKGSEMAMANKTMMYIMPVMIAIFTASVPAGVGLYWGVSTLFAIGQQVVANKVKS